MPKKKAPALREEDQGAENTTPSIAGLENPPNAAASNPTSTIAKPPSPQTQPPPFAQSPALIICRNKYANLFSSSSLMLTAS